MVNRCWSVLFITLFNIGFLNAQSALYVGQSISLAEPSVSGVIDAITWYSDHSNNLSITETASGATVNVNSYFTGTATIECTYAYRPYSGGYGQSGSAYYYLTCRKSTVTLDRMEITLKVGQTATLAYNNSSGYVLPNVYWKTSDMNIAELTDSREWISGAKSVTVTGVDVGQCTILCRGFSGSDDVYCTVNVIGNPATAITLNPNSLTLREQATGSFSYKLTPADAYTKITWKSSNESVAKVSAVGKVTAVSTGSATITATTDNGLSASGLVTVTPLPQQVLLPNNQTITVGYSYPLTPTVKPQNATTVYTWESADPRIAMVDAMGNVTGKGVGSTIITVKTDNGKKASCTVNVKEPIEGTDHRNVKIRHELLKTIIKKSLQNL